MSEGLEEFREKLCGCEISIKRKGKGKKGKGRWRLEYDESDNIICPEVEAESNEVNIFQSVCLSGGEVNIFQREHTLRSHAVLSSSQ